MRAGVLQSSRLPWYSRSVDSTYLTGKRVFIFGDAAHAIAAARIAQERNVRLGGEVGYQIRFERVESAQTRIKFVTEALLLRQMASDPELKGVGAVVFDEFHERSLEADLALAMARRVREEAREDLRLIATSATLQAEPIAAFLGGAAGPAPIVTSEGRLFMFRNVSTNPSSSFAASPH